MKYWRGRDATPGNNPVGTNGLTYSLGGQGHPNTQTPLAFNKAKTSTYDYDYQWHASTYYPTMNIVLLYIVFEQWAWCHVAIVRMYDALYHYVIT